MPDSNNNTTPDSFAAPQMAVGQKLGGRSALLNDHFEVFFDHALPRYGHTGAQVYQAKSNRADGPLGLAYVCDRHIVPCVLKADKYVAIENPTAAQLLSKGVLKCPDGIERYTFIFQNNFGKPLVPMAGEKAAYGMKAETVINAVLRPIASMLLAMHNADLPHGAIRLANIFDGGTSPLQRVVVGDCLAHFYLGAQPALYLSPFLSMANPSGRGLGSMAEDIYALGVVCALLLRSHDTTSDKTDDEIFLSKIDFGTFSTLIENERLSSDILEMLRGMLNDDPALRWTIYHVQEFLEGKRSTTRQGSKKLKASRHIVLNNHKILSPVVFLFYARQDPAEAAREVETGEVRQWIRRSIGDAKLDERYEVVIESCKEFGRGPGYQDRLIARLCVALEPNAPISYRGIYAFPDSFGNALVELMFKGTDPKPVADLIIDQMFSFWMNMQDEVPADFNLVNNKFEQCQQFLKQKAVGYGIERCAYFLVPEAPCLSPSLASFYVTNSEQLFRALNLIAEQTGHPERILDRHMISFLSARDRKLVEPFLPDLSSADASRNIAGVINLLAEIQRTSRGILVPGLTKWIFNQVAQIYDRYHDRDTRARLRKKMEELRDAGSVIKMADLLFGGDQQRRDQQEFRLAMREYAFLGAEAIGLTEALKTPHLLGMRGGRDAAAMIAGFLMVIAVVGFMLIHFSQGVTF